MIVTELLHGQGLGNQIWCYVVTRCLSILKNTSFSILNSNNFKGNSFLDLDFGRDISFINNSNQILSIHNEKRIWHKELGFEITKFDKSIYNVGIDTNIIGCFQSEEFIEPWKKNISQWLRLKPNLKLSVEIGDNLCVLNVRGGDYKGNPDLILPKRYWLNAVRNMLKIRNDMDFVVVTDDVKYSKKLLPEFKIIHDGIGSDYKIINSAKYLILSNSSFAFFPAWTNSQLKSVIAPKFWARHNISNGLWSSPVNLYKNWNWQDRDGVLMSYNDCLVELNYFMRELKNKDISNLFENKKISLLYRCKRKFKSKFNIIELNY